MHESAWMTVGQLDALTKEYLEPESPEGRRSARIETVRLAHWFPLAGAIILLGDLTNDRNNNECDNDKRNNNNTDRSSPCRRILGLLRPGPLVRSVLQMTTMLAGIAYRLQAKRRCLQPRSRRNSRRRIRRQGKTVLYGNASASLVNVAEVFSHIPPDL